MDCDEIWNTASLMSVGATVLAEKNLIRASKFECLPYNIKVLWSAESMNSVVIDRIDRKYALIQTDANNVKANIAHISKNTPQQTYRQSEFQVVWLMLTSTYL